MTEVYNKTLRCSHLANTLVESKFKSKATCMHKTTWTVRQKTLENIPPHLNKSHENISQECITVFQYIIKSECHTNNCHIYFRHSGLFLHISDKEKFPNDRKEETLEEPDWSWEPKVWVLMTKTANHSLFTFIKFASISWRSWGGGSDGRWGQAAMVRSNRWPPQGRSSGRPDNGVKITASGQELWRGKNWDGR